MRSQGYDTAAHWYRFALQPAEGVPAEWVLNIGMPYLGELDVWIKQPTGIFRHHALGNHRPYADRPLQTRLFSVPLELTAPAEIYLRVRSASAITVSAELWRLDAFIAQETRSNLMLGIYFGILLIVAVFYAILGAWLRDVIMASYAGYVATLVVTHMGLNGYLPLFTGSPAPGFDSTLIRASLMVGAIFILMMWNRLLDLRRNYPPLRHVFLLLGLACLGAMFIGTTPWFEFIASPVNLLAMLIAGGIPVLQAVHWWRDRRPEYVLYFVAFIIPALSGVVRGLMLMGVLPENWLTAHAFQAASLIHVLVMSFGLALRLRQVQQDKAAAENAATVAAQRAEEQRRFVAMLSHEFRNPLAAIDRSAQMIQFKTPGLAESETQRLAQIRGNVATLAGFVDNFLMTEALDHGALALAREPCALRPLLENAIRMQGEAADQRVRLSVTPDDAAFPLDATLIGVAVGNLVGNALRYSPPESPVEVNAVRDEQGVCIRVADHGPGLSKEDLAKLGSPYYRAKTSLGKKGSGLGYHFTRCIVEAHGGTLTARPGNGLGLEVEIRLPK